MMWWKDCNIEGLFGGLFCTLAGKFKGFVTDPSSESNRGCDCVVGLECILSIVRALRMGSCLSAESWSPLPGSPSSLHTHMKKRNSRRRPGMGSRNSSFDYRKEEALHWIPGRLFLNGSSDVACLFSQQGKKGTNQDAMIVWEVSSFLSISPCLFSNYNLVSRNGHLIYLASCVMFSWIALKTSYLSYNNNRTTLPWWQI